MPETPQRLTKFRFLINRWTLTAATLALSVFASLAVLDNQHRRTHQGSVPDIYRGPWGDLQFWDVRLEQPLEYRSFDRTSSNGPIWHFGPASPEQIEKLLIESGLPMEQAHQLLATRKVLENGECTLQPDLDTLFGLSADSRSKLYRALAGNPANNLQANPFFIPDGVLSRVLKGGHFQDLAALEKLLLQLCYPRNGYTYFSDPEAILQRLRPEEYGEFMKCILSTNAVMARILIKPGASIDAPVYYWSMGMPGVRLKDVYPVFLAQQQLPDGGSIPISYLLSPAAREALYKTPIYKEGEKLPDCHWTALNFFNLHPDPRMADNGFASDYIRENFYEIGKPGLDGDLVLLFDPKGGVVHSAVYLAADLVYTKNGINLGSPWVLMHERDMIGMFSALEPVHAGYFRRNEY